jgi:chaperonin GroEL
MEIGKDNIHLNSLPKMALGIKKATDVVRVTMGAAGKNVSIEQELYPYTSVLNDGATIIKAIELDDAVEAQGLSFVKEAVDRSNNNSGDGSTTTCVLLDAILDEGIKSGVSSMEIKRSLDECLPVIEASLRDQSKPVTVDDIPMVARIAGESEILATTLGDIYKTIGADGIVEIEPSGTYDTSFSLVDGVRFVRTGYLSPWMVHDEDASKRGAKETRAVYEKPAVLVTKRKITHINEINPILGALQAQNKNTLVIFCDDMDSNVAALLVELHKSKTFNVTIVKAPTIYKGYVFDDFAKVTGATVVEDTNGVTFKNFKLDYLGTCSKIIVTRDETTVVDIADITDHIEALRLEDTEDAKRRICWLKTKTAILKIGAKSETELSYLRYKAEDAVHSSRLALEGGIVAGGGVALLNAAAIMPDTIGGNILRSALSMPMKQIIANTGKDVSISQDRQPLAGYDAKENVWRDMIESGIVDSTIVVRQAIRNALGIASTLLTTASVITLPKRDEKDGQHVVNF